MSKFAQRWIAVGVVSGLVLVGLALLASRWFAPQSSPQQAAANSQTRNSPSASLPSLASQSSPGTGEIIRPAPSKKTGFPAAPPLTATNIPAVLQTIEPAKLNRGVSRRTNAAINGDLAEARITTADNHIYKLQPNQVGHFAQVYVRAEETVAAQVSYPRGQVGDPVQVQILDGGKFEAGPPAQTKTLDKDGRLAFNFQVTGNRGIHRVKLVKGADQKVLEFWVGDPLPIRE